MTASWQSISQQPPFVLDPQIVSDAMLLLTDGSVLCHDPNVLTRWWRYTPDASGSYLTGTWAPLGAEMREPMADFGGDFGRRERQVGGGIGSRILEFAHGRTEILFES